MSSASAAGAGAGAFFCAHIKRRGEENDKGSSEPVHGIALILRVNLIYRIG